MFESVQQWWENCRFQKMSFEFVRDRSVRENTIAHTIAQTLHYCFCTAYSVFDSANSVSIFSNSAAKIYNWSFPLKRVASKCNLRQCSSTVLQFQDGGSRWARIFLVTIVIRTVLHWQSLACPGDSWQITRRGFGRLRTLV